METNDALTGAGANMELDDFKKVLNEMPAEQKEAFIQALSKAHGVAPQQGPQMQAFLSEADVLGYGGAAGGGKAQINTSLVQTPTGAVRIDSLKPNDLICNAKGGTSRIVATKQWDNWRTLKVSFSDGTNVFVAPEHIWLAWRSHYSIQAKGHPLADKNNRLHGEASATLMSTEEIAANIAKGGHRYRIPMCEPTEGYGKIPIDIDPYSLGALIGDGCFTGDNCRIGMGERDIEILETMANALEGFNIKRHASSPGIINARLSRKSKDYKVLKEAGFMGKYSYEKSLPPMTNYAHTKWRWSLLQGLMDTDGTVAPKRCAVYSTSSPMLRDDVAGLARSLGCFVTITDKIPTYTNKGVKLKGRRHYTLRIKSKTPAKLFRLRRHKEIAATLKPQSHAKVIISIKEAPRADCTCIQVDNEDGLYLTSDYTVTHNSALIVLLALLSHHHSMVYRKDAAQMSSMTEDMVNFAGTNDGFNGNEKIFKMPNGKVIRWGGLKDPGDERKYKGKPHDLTAFDEVTEIRENQFRYLLTWNRPAVDHANQRCRVVMTFNPPGDVASQDDENIETGLWVMKYFAPWIDPSYKGIRADYGELRYFIRDAEIDADVEVTDPSPRKMLDKNGQPQTDKKGVPIMIKPQSRTFIPAKVWDNKYLADNMSYVSQLHSLPKNLRDKMLNGEFTINVRDNNYQVIPGDWIRQAFQRYEDNGLDTCTAGKKMLALGVDVGRGGDDTIIQSLFEGLRWGTHKTIDRKVSRDGHKVGSEIAAIATDEAVICMDVIGVGNSPYDWLKHNTTKKIIPIAANSQPYKTRLSHFEMLNMRAWLYWMMRKILDPTYNLQPMIAPCETLYEELVAHRYTDRGGKLVVLPKDEVKKRIGRSPDRADALVYSIANIRNEKVYYDILTDRKKKPSNEIEEVQTNKNKDSWMTL